MINGTLLCLLHVGGLDTLKPTVFTADKEPVYSDTSDTDDVTYPTQDEAVVRAKVKDIQKLRPIKNKNISDTPGEIKTSPVLTVHFMLTVPLRWMQINFPIYLVLPKQVDRRQKNDWI